MSSQQPPTTRRERRAAERATGRQAAASPSTSAAGRNPVLVVTLAALGIGLVIVAALVIAGAMGGSSLPPVTAAAGAAPPVDLRDGRALGQVGAPVSIEVWEDPQCPACGIYTRQVEPFLVAGPIRDGRVRLTYHDMVFLGPESLDAAVGMRAAEQLGGKFWDFREVVFANQHGENKGAFSRDRLAEMAVLLGLDRQAFLAALDDPALIAAVRSETSEGQDRGITRTPTLVINGQAQEGAPSWESLKATIDRLAPPSGQG